MALNNCNKSGALMAWLAFPRPSVNKDMETSMEAPARQASASTLLAE